MSARKLRKISARYQQDVSRMQSATQGANALDPYRIGAHMPSVEEEYKKSEYHADLCDATKRRGAGQITGQSGVILRPNGMANYHEFHDYYTREAEKEKQRERINLHEQKQKYEGPPFRTIAFPETFCILCMKKDVAPSNASCQGKKNCKCCPMQDITTLTQGIMELDLKPLDVIRSTICPDCKIEIMKERSDSHRSGVTIYHDGQHLPANVLKAAQRYRTLKNNWRYVLKASRLVGIDGGTNAARAEGIGTA